MKGKGTKLDFKVRLFDTGAKEWNEFEEFPLSYTEDVSYFATSDHQLTKSPTGEPFGIEYVSDPNNPVPYLEENDFHKMAPKHYFTDDQRFLQDRNDVITFQTDVLEEDVTVLGEIKAFVNFITDHGDADLYVKIVDVYPDNREVEENDLEGIKYQGYQQLVRVGYIRGRFRNGFDKPEPFTPNEPQLIQVPLLEIYHTFKKGHRIMIMVQSSMFPLFGMNPQKYVDNIYFAEPKDFESAKHKIIDGTRFVFPVLRSNE